MKLRPTNPQLISSASPPIGHNSASMPAMQIRLTIEYVAPDTLIPSEKSLRIHTKTQIRQIARSMERFGFLIPILASVDSRVISGEGRLMAALKLGLPEVPVVRVEHLTPAQITAFQIADNRLAENSSWDRRLLGEALRDLSLQDLDFDLEITGFEVAEIDLLIEGLNLDGDDPDDEPVGAGPAVTRPFDLWEILGHRVFCGDSQLEASFAAVMAGEMAAATVSDPPYNINIQGNAAGFGKVKYAEFAMASGEMSEVEYTDFLIRICQLIAAHSAGGALAYLFSDWRHLFEAIVAGRRAFAAQRNFCVWAKTSAGQGSFYRSQHELVLVWTAKAGKPRNNIQLGRFGRHRSNLWSCPSPSSFGRAGEEGRLTVDHATPKPVALIADAILDCTARGDIVLDPFLGGGATLVAAERTGRRCRAIEIEPKFVDAAIRRLMRLTGEDARRVGDGRLFSDLEREEGRGDA